MRYCTVGLVTACHISETTVTRALVVSLSPADSRAQKNGRQYDTDQILENPGLAKATLCSVRLAASLYRDLHLRISKTIDLFSLSPTDCSDAATLLISLVGETNLHIPNVHRTFKTEALDGDVATTIVSRAWVACQVVLRQSQETLMRITKLDTTQTDEQASL